MGVVVHRNSGSRAMIDPLTICHVIMMYLSVYSAEPILDSYDFEERPECIETLSSLNEGRKEMHQGTVFP